MPENEQKKGSSRNLHESTVVHEQRTVASTSLGSKQDSCFADLHSQNIMLVSYQFYGFCTVSTHFKMVIAQTETLQSTLNWLLNFTSVVLTHAGPK